MYVKPIAAKRSLQTKGKAACAASLRATELGLGMGKERRLRSNMGTNATLAVHQHAAV
jgi:hypothetical protein